MKHGTLRLSSGFFFVILIMSACSKTDLQKNIDNDSSKAKPMAKFDDALSNQVILDWNLAALEAEGGVTYLHALFASRTNTMMHIAMHDALNAIVPVYEQYAYHANGEGADPVLAAAQAAYTVLLNIYPTAKPMLDNLLQKYLALTPDGPAEQKAIMTGEAAGMAIVALRQNDGSSQDPVGPMAVSDVPGVYNTVPPVYVCFWRILENHAAFLDRIAGPVPYRPTACTCQHGIRERFQRSKSIGRSDKHDTDGRPKFLCPLLV